MTSKDNPEILNDTPQPEPVEAPYVLEERLAVALHALQAEDEVLLREELAHLAGKEIAHLMAAAPAPWRLVVWHNAPEALRGEILAGLNEGVREEALGFLEEKEAVIAAADLPSAQLAEVVEAASDHLADIIIRSLPRGEQERLAATMAFPEGSVGRLMQTEWAAVRSDVTLEVVARYVRFLGALPHHTDGLMVVDREGLYLGKLSLADLLTLPEGLTVAEVMEAEADWIHVSADREEAARQFELRDAASVAVLDDDRKLVGRLTWEEMLPIIKGRMEQDMLHMARLNEDEDLFAPIIPSTKRRLFWLGVNLATAFLAAFVIGRFQNVLEQIVALAVLMPIVASMGGIAGSQTLTLVVRGLALGHIADANLKWLVKKELVIGLVNGAAWAVVVGVATWVWFQDLKIAAIIGSALLISIPMAALAGLYVPMALKKLGADPALAGSVTLTTFTDVFGFLSFLGLATLFLL